MSAYMAWLCDVDVAPNTKGLWHLEVQQYRKISANMLRGPLHMHRLSNEAKTYPHLMSDLKRTFRTSESYYHCFLSEVAVPSRPTLSCHASRSPTSTQTLPSPPPPSRPSPSPLPSSPLPSSPPPLSPIVSETRASSAWTRPLQIPESDTTGEWQERKRREAHSRQPSSSSSFLHLQDVLPHSAPSRPLQSRPFLDQRRPTIPHHHHSAAPALSFAHVAAASSTHIALPPSPAPVLAVTRSSPPSVSQLPLAKQPASQLHFDAPATTAAAAYLPPHMRAPFPRRPPPPTFILRHT